MSAAITDRTSKKEILFLIRYYDRRGWCWFGAVEYLCWKAEK